MWLEFSLVFPKLDMCKWNIELLIWFIIRIPSILQHRSICGVTSTIIIFSKTHLLPIYQGHSIWTRTTGRCIILKYILRIFISLCTLWPSILLFVLMPPAKIRLFIYTLIFILFDQLFNILDLEFPQNMADAAVPTRICVYLHEPVILSAKIMVGGDCLLEFFWHIPV